MVLDTQYHCSVKPVSRSAGRSAVAAAAYRSGSVLLDERTGLIHDYTRKRGVVLSEIAVPPGCDWAQDRAALWNAVEAKTRANGRVATEVEVSLPHTLTHNQRAELVRGFAASLAAEGVAVDYSIHAPHPHRRPRDGALGADLPGDDDRNWHAHVLVSHLPITPDGPGKRVSKLFDGPAAVEAVRARWAEHVNRAYVAAGLEDLRQDHRSYADQGIDRTPTRHIGPTVVAMERRGVVTERGNVHRARQEARRADIAIALLDGEQQRRAARRQHPPPLAAPPPAPAQPKPPPPPQQQETAAMKKYTHMGRVAGRGGRPIRRPPRQDAPKHQHEQTSDLRAWLWTQAYAPAAIPRGWLHETTAMWTFGRDGDPDGIYAQLSGDAGRLYDNGSSVTWDHAGAATDEERSTAIEAMLDMAAEGRGWTSLSFFGDQRFREEAARAATRRGITVADDDLKAVVEAERRRMAEQQRATPGATTNGIAQATSVPMAAVAAAVPPVLPSPTVAAFLAAGQEARKSGHDLDAWLALYAARLTHEQRGEIAAHFAAGQPAGAAKWTRATENALTAETLIAAQQRGDQRAVRAVLDVTTPEQQRVVSDMLHARADAAMAGDPTDLADLRRRSAAQALAQNWDRLSDGAERATRGAARVEESQPSTPTVADLRRLGEALLSAQRAARDGSGDPLDATRAERALTTALDRTTPETRRALADGLTDHRGGRADALASTLAVAALVSESRAKRMAGMPEGPFRALSPSEPEQTAKGEPSDNSEYDLMQPEFIT